MYRNFMIEKNKTDFVDDVMNLFFIYSLGAFSFKNRGRELNHNFL